MRNWFSNWFSSDPEKRLDADLEKTKQSLRKALKRYGIADERINVLFEEQTTINELRNLLTELDKKTPEEIEMILTQENAKDQKLEDRLLGSSPSAPPLEEIDTTSNFTLLENLTGNLSSLVQDIQKNNSIIEQLSAEKKKLEEELVRIESSEEGYQSQLEEAENPALRGRLVKMIEKLNMEKRSVEVMIGKLQEQIRSVRGAVQQQNQQIQGMGIPQQGSGRSQRKTKHPLKALQGINKMKRTQLNKVANEWGLSPNVYNKKSNAQDAVKLMLAVKMIGLKKLKLAQLKVVAQNYGLETKGVKKDVLMKKLKKKMKNVTLM